MKVTEHPYNRGKHNAEAIIDQSGLLSAIKWLEQRQAEEPLDERYVRGYQEAVLRERPWPPKHDIPMLVNMVMWSLVWIVTGGGEGDDPNYKCPPNWREANVWASWKESQ